MTELALINCLIFFSLPLDIIKLRKINSIYDIGNVKLKSRWSKQILEHIALFEDSLLRLRSILKTLPQ